jgi:hypothetical protein
MSWQATFYTTGMEHSPTSATGTGWERTPWHATQRAAWEALKAMQVLGHGLSTSLYEDHLPRRMMRMSHT